MLNVFLLLIHVHFCNKGKRFSTSVYNGKIHINNYLTQKKLKLKLQIEDNFDKFQVIISVK